MSGTPESAREGKEDLSPVLTAVGNGFDFKQTILKSITSGFKVCSNSPSSKELQRQGTILLFLGGILPSCNPVFLRVTICYCLCSQLLCNTLACLAPLVTSSLPGTHGRAQGSRNAGLCSKI